MRVSRNETFISGPRVSLLISLRLKQCWEVVEIHWPKASNKMDLLHQTLFDTWTSHVMAVGSVLNMFVLDAVRWCWIRLKLGEFKWTQNNPTMSRPNDPLRSHNKKINNYTPEISNVESFAVASLTLLKQKQEENHERTWQSVEN